MSLADYLTDSNLRSKVISLDKSKYLTALHIKFLHVQNLFPYSIKLKNNLACQIITNITSKRIQ